jgi:hypothetical protein
MFLIDVDKGCQGCSIRSLLSMRCHILHGASMTPHASCLWLGMHRISGWINVADPDPGSEIQDPVLFYPLDPRSGSGMNFFRIPDLGSWIQEVCFLVLFYPRIQDPDPGWSNGRIRIRDKPSRIRNTDRYLLNCLKSVNARNHSLNYISTGTRQWYNKRSRYRYLVGARYCIFGHIPFCPKNTYQYLLRSCCPHTLTSLQMLHL